MKSFWARLLINMAAIAATAWLLPGITIGGNQLLTVLLVALIFGLVNAIIKPIFSFLTCGLVCADARFVYVHCQCTDAIGHRVR